MTGSRRPAFASDDWLLEQQFRAEVEAEAWRRMRAELTPPPEAAPALANAPVAPPAIDHHRAGSTILKALVRFALAAFGAYLAYLAGFDSQLGEFEIWLATGSAFMVTLALTMFGPMRGFVLMLAETARWAVIVAVGLGAVWMFVQMSA